MDRLMKREQIYVMGRGRLDTNILRIIDIGMEFGNGTCYFGLKEVLGYIIPLEAMKFHLYHLQDSHTQP